MPGRCAESNHYHYRAVDLWQVDGAPVTAGNDAARALVQWVATVAGPLRPDEVGSPWGGPWLGHFTDAAHRDHVHLGWDAPGGGPPAVTTTSLT